MHKRNRSLIDTGRWHKRKVGDGGVPKDSWDIAQDLFLCRIPPKDPYPVVVDKPSKDGYKEAREILSTAVKEFHISQGAIHTVRIRMFQAQFSSTEDQARGLPISCPSALRRKVM